MVKSIVMFIFVDLCWLDMFLNGYVALRKTLMVMLDCIVYQLSCCIGMFLKGYA